ncbi:PACE efflux transporter [Vibrio sp. S11_S32]|uniref:PACE efflux transporter n=1 Tax=Vibrio sp. S11_S32 TaxID=2720225 RepID=UPI0016808B73|nr:PACE efflux transporter [Vibrio sp. S11_S32]MBD1577757.1 PACE efflux transporter [Vibrio sp. S11_S32]
MRSKLERIRHTVGFEVLGLIILIFGISKIFNMDMGKIGVLAILFSVIATVWNYFYNILFDKAMLKRTGQLHKTTLIRILHAVLFEFGLLFITLPIMAWWLHIRLIDALILDFGMVIFYLIYAFVYNLAYDKVFPIAPIRS